MPAARAHRERTIEPHRRPPLARPQAVVRAGEAVDERSYLPRRRRQDALVQCLIIRSSTYLMCTLLLAWRAPGRCREEPEPHRSRTRIGRGVLGSRCQM
jgi:hypothetical protein